MAKAYSLKVIVLADDYAGYEMRGLLGQHGLSVYLEVKDSHDKVWKLLLDTGQHGESIINNAHLLGLKLDEIGSIVLSHNHYDHTGGLLDIIKLREKVFVVAHPDVFKPSISIKGDNVRLDIGIPYTMEEMRENGAKFLLLKSPLEVAPGVYFLGEIERDPDFFTPLKSNYTIEEGILKPHKLLDDTAVAVKVDGFGTVVVTGCSHSGIVNIVRKAEEVTKSEVHAVIGGFHLLSAKKDFIEKTINALKDMGVKEVHTGHCTGLLAEYMFLSEYKDNFKKIHSGYTVKYPKDK
ncbi:MAG: MBL fold metallo-hydrolase [Candidatus Asgardarchaeia archaeon]